MLSFIKIDTDDLAIAPGQKILKAHDYMHYLESENMIISANNKAQEIIEEANSIYLQEKERGYKEGQLAARNECAAMLTDTLSQCNHYYLTAENEIVKTVILCVKKVLSDFNDNELTLAITKEALKKVSNQKQVILHVNPIEVIQLKENISTILVSFPDIDFIDVIADERVSTCGCIVETDIGSIDATIEVQLQSLETQINKYFNQLHDEKNNK